MPSLLSRFLAVFFHLLYHQMAWAYDAVAAIVSLGMWKTWVHSILTDLNHGSILELGPGPGHLQVSLNHKGVTCFGLDASPQMARLSRRKLVKGGHPCRLVHGQAQSLPYPSQAFDQVAATFPSEYIYDPKTLHDIYRVLIPGGALIVIPLAWITGDAILERFARWLFRVTGQAGEWHDGYTRPLEEVGFQVTVTQRAIKSSRVLVLHAHKQHHNTVQ